ncbi:hypothetical protein ASD04_17815 [Devosia sp. Root436]|nr:hypothetical protein ASD04_17815 [Devosia sp. Root436]
MRANWVACTSKDHEGRTVYINLDRVDLIYADEGETFVVMAGWDTGEDGGPLHVEETPETILAGASK